MSTQCEYLVNRTSTGVNLYSSLGRCQVTLLLHLLAQLLPQSNGHLQRQFTQPHRNDVGFFDRDFNGELLHVRLPRGGVAESWVGSSAFQSAARLPLP